MTNLCLRDDPIFIVGYKRSGTTLLRLMLNRHESIFIPEESGYYQTLPKIFGKKILDTKDIGSVIDTFNRGVYAGKFDENVLNELITEQMPCTIDIVLACLYQTCAHHAGKANKRWGDKKPQHWQFVYKLKEWYPHAQFIHIIRDPKDTISSILQYTKKNDVKLTQHEFVYKIPLLPAHIVLAWHIRYANDQVGKQARLLPKERILKTRYEDIVENATFELTRIASFLKMENLDVEHLLAFQEDARNPDVLGKADAKSEHMNETRKKLNNNRLARYKKNLTPKQISDIDFINCKGYEKYEYLSDKNEPSAARKFYLNVACICLSGVWYLVRTFRRMNGSL